MSKSDYPSVTVNEVKDLFNSRRISASGLLAGLIQDLPHKKAMKVIMFLCYYAVIMKNMLVCVCKSNQDRIK